ncbi:MAG: hypothetical protein RIR26_1002 [Pseudomonadota bacterium]
MPRIKNTTTLGLRVSAVALCASLMIATPLNRAWAGETATRTARVKEWLAFGSGCRSSSQAPQNDLTVESRYSENIRTSLRMSRFELELPIGGKGVRECAFRMVITPPPDVRVTNVQARTRLVANKTSQEHLRGRILLLLGDNVVDQKIWNLEKTDFAKFRDELITLVSGAKSEFSTPQTSCGKEQIVGLDFTLEGVSDGKTTAHAKTVEEKLFLRVPPEAVTEIVVDTAECHRPQQEKKNGK